MDFRQLRYFVAVAEELSFSGAARRLHVSQPPLSLQVKALEEELGSVLLNRNNRKVELTEAGSLFLEQARHALAHLERAGDVVRQAARGEAGELRIRSEEHTSELQSLMRNSYAVFCLKTKKHKAPKHSKMITLARQ